MRKTLAALGAASLLAGCGTAVENEAAVTSTPTSTGAARDTGPTDLEIGEAAHLTTDGQAPRDIDVTVSEIQVFEQCPEGELDSLTRDKDEGVYLLVKWDTDVRESADDYAATEWVGVGEGGTVLETETASECRQPDGVKSSGYVLPGTNASEGQVFWAAEKPTRWFLNEVWEPHAFAWPVPDEVSAVTEQTAIEVPMAQEEQAPAVAEEPAPTVVRCQNHGGTALMSDGSEAYSASCDENAGGLVPGNTGNAYGPLDTADNNYIPDTSGDAGW